MNLTISTSEVEDVCGISRFQVSRYAAAGRLERTRHGRYVAASLARVLVISTGHYRCVVIARHFWDKGRRERAESELLDETTADFRKRLEDATAKRAYPPTPAELDATAKDFREVLKDSVQVRWNGYGKGG